MRVVGYTANADTWCPWCVPYDPDGKDGEGNPVYPIFSDSEWDYPVHCRGCGAFLKTRLTAEGENYVRESVLRAIREGSRDSVALTVWYYEFDYLFDDGEVDSHA